MSSSEPPSVGVCADRRPRPRDARSRRAPPVGSSRTTSRGSPGERERDAEPTALAAGEPADLARDERAELEALDEHLAPAAAARSGRARARSARARAASAGNAISCGVTPTSRRERGTRGSAPKSRAVPRSGTRSPSRSASAVDLPAPFGPEQRHDLAVADRERDIVERCDRARSASSTLDELRRRSCPRLLRRSASVRRKTL